MKKIKDNNKLSDKVKRPEETKTEKMFFGFNYITDNKRYGFNRITDKHDRLEFYETLTERLKDLSGLTIQESKERGKYTGSEPIPFKSLSKPFQEVCLHTRIVTADSSLIVFRFNSQDYRIICKNDINQANLMNIIGFDTDHSAYDHG